MKIGIITLQDLTNYGCILQNWALQKKLQEDGHDIITLKYLNNYDKNIINYIRDILTYIIKHLIHHPSRNLNELPWQRKPVKYTYNFFKKNIKLTKYLSKINENSLSKYKLDCIIIGSDQVWRGQYIKKRLELMFGGFYSNLKNIKKISYAASLGTDKWEFSDSETEIIKTYIRSFNAVSIREDAGVELFYKHLGQRAQQMVDPTLLIDSKEYNSLIPSTVLNKAPKNKLGVYILDLTPQKLELVNRLSRFLNKEIYIFGNIDEATGQKHSIELWLAGFYLSDFIVTDSYHGTIFSLIYKKNFLTIGNVSRGIVRFTSLLHKFGLEERLVSPDYKIENISKLKDINWVEVSDIIKSEKDIAKRFLNENLN